LIVAEPLAAPFQRTGTGKWLGINSNAVLSGSAPISLQFTAYDPSHPLQQIDLFVDGKHFSTLTNLGPQAGNVLTIALNGYPINYTVPNNATLGSISTGLVAALNLPGITNLTKTTAFAQGDRIELHTATNNTLGTPFYFNDSAPSTPKRFYRVVYVSQPSAPALTPLGRDVTGAFRLHLEPSLSTSVVIQASTNLINWVPVFTNTAGGPVDFVDLAAPAFSKRFYRASGILTGGKPILTALGRGSNGGFKLHIESPNAANYVLQASTNLLAWTPILTNSFGSSMDYEDLAATNSPRRFYRISASIPVPPDPTVSLVSQTPTGSLLRVDGAVQPFIIEASTDLANWSRAFTNLNIGKVTTSTASSKGSAAVASTLLKASRDTFLESTAIGRQSVSINGTLQIGTWLRIDVTKTNGAVVSFSVTNTLFSAMIMDLTSSLFSAINANPSLQGPDGLSAEDLAQGSFGAGTFTLKPRSPGFNAASISANVTGSSSLVINPGNASPLTQNLSDLQPRNHLFIAAGTTNLQTTFALNTSLLPDGYHDLTAVAYEGSHVRSQTRIFLPIIVHNSTFSATLNPLDFGTNALTQGTYHLQVVSNTNNVSAIRLYATGGLLSTISNQSTATFTFNGTNLGTGLHPLYAILDRTNGPSYRTQTKWLRLTDGP